MTAVRDDTLVVCFVSSDACRRAYELEVIRELGAKRLGLRKVVVGDRVPRECLADEDVAVPYEDVGILRDDEMTVVDVLVGQLLGFFRCLHEGLAPDAPSPQAVITRVVPPFTLHRRPGS